MMDEQPQTQLSSIEARLKLIEDRQAIYDVIVRYCRGVDRSDPDMVSAAFHDDAIDNHFGVVLPFREAIGTLKSARDAGAPSSKTTSMHNICNVLIEVDGDVDRFERRNGEWRIAYRTVVYDLERFDEVMPAPGDLSQAHYLDNAVRGRRGLSDYSYQIFSPAPYKY